MKEWILEKALEFLVANLTKERIEEWVSLLMGIIIPWVRSQKFELIKALAEKAKETDNNVDDEAVKALDHFLEALIPDNATCFPAKK